MHSQRTAHARTVIQPDPEFSGSGIGLFQGLLGPFCWTRVTDALGTRLPLPCIPYSVQLLHIDTDCKAGLTLVKLLLNRILLSFSVFKHTNVN